MTTQEPCFERIRSIGSGATSQVDLAHLVEPFGDLPAGHPVAVKSLHGEASADEEALAAFRAEAEAGAQARDPSLVRVLHHGVRDGRPFLLLQYVPGKSLRGILDEQEVLPEPLVRSVGEQLAGALAALHEAGLVHGDVKPENIRLDEEGRAVLVDLGFACRFGATHERRDAGSLAYLSPERARGGPPSPEADVFALGVVLYELATGVHPFGYGSPDGAGSGPGTLPGHGSTSVALLRRSIEIEGADQLLAAITTARIVPPSHLNPHLSPFLDYVLEVALRRPDERRPTAEVLRDRIGAAESGEWWRRRVDPQVAAQDEAVPALRSGAHLTPLVGRDRELARLAECLAEVRRDGRPDVVWLTSPEGGGKWRLVSEFAARARASDDPPLYLYARWSEVAEAMPGGALLILLHRWLHLPIGADPGPRERALLEELVPPHAAETLLSALRRDEKENLGDATPNALASWVTRLGRGRTVLLFLDDLQLAGPVTIEALSRTLGALGPANLLIVLGARADTPREAEHFARFREYLLQPRQPGGRFDVHEIDLGPLHREAVHALVDQLFDRRAPRVRLAEVLWKRSQGNPGQLKELIYDLTTRGDAVPAEEGGKLLLAISPDDLPLPRSLSNIIGERFAALDPTERRWLERLAVVGGRIAPDFLTRAFPPTVRSEADEVLARLVHLGWLAPAGDRYRFARPALREAVYRTLSPARRARLHLAAARGLDDADSSEEQFQRAFHLRAAGDRQELLDIVLHLVRAQRRRASSRRLLTLAHWGLESLDERASGTERERLLLELLEVAADAADRLGLRDDQRELLDSMADLELDLERHPAEGARLYLLHGRFASSTGQFGLARGMLRNAMQLARAAGDEGVESQAARHMTHVQAQVGELEEARGHALRALELAQGENQEALAHLALVHLDVLSDRPEEGLRRVDQALKVLREAKDVRPGVVAYAHLLRARIWRSAGRPGRALGAVQRSLRLARRSGERRLEAEARARFGALLLDQDRPDDAEAQLREALLAADEIEDRRGQVLARMWLGLLLWEEDDRQARAMIEDGIELAREIGFYRAEMVGQAILARVLGAAGELEAADEASEEGTRLLERHGAELADRIAVSGTRALILRERGRARAAEAIVARLRKRVEKSGAQISDPVLREDQREYARRVLDTALSAEGPVYPRTS